MLHALIVDQPRELNQQWSLIRYYAVAMKIIDDDFLRPFGKDMMYMALNRDRDMHVTRQNTCVLPGSCRPGASCRPGDLVTSTKQEARKRARVAEAQK